MMTKAIFGLAALFGMAGVGLSLAETRTGCCAAGAECCFPGSACCGAGDCCAPGADCCLPGAPCCETLAANASDCCAPGAECCFPGSPCCGDDCCAPGSLCCVPGAACCALTAVSADEAPAPQAKAARNCCGGGGCAAQPDQPMKADAATSKIAVDGMSCAGCAKTVGKAVSAVEGVESAVADVKTKTLTVVAKKGATPSPRAMWEAVEKAGYKPTRIEGAAGTFEKKPER